MTYDLSGLDFKPIKQNKSFDLSGLDFKPIENAQAMSNQPPTQAAMQPAQGGFMGGVDKFNRAVERTGIPDFATGFFQGGQNALANTLNFISQVTGNKDFQGNPIRFPKADYGRHGTAAGMGDIVGAGANYLFPGAVAKVLPNVGKIGAGVDAAISASPKIAEGMASAGNALSAIPGYQKAAAAIGSPIGQNAIGGGLFGAAQSPDNRLLGGTLGAGGSLAFDAIPMAGRAILNHFARPRATQQEAQNVLNALPANLRDEVPIGELVNSSPLRSFQTNVLGNTPLSGMSKPYEMLNQHIGNEGKQIYEGLLGGRDAKNIPQEVYGAVKKNYENLSKETNAAYTKFRDAAENSGTPFNPSKINESANKKLSELQKEVDISPELKEDYGKAMSMLSNFSKTKISNFKEAEEFRRLINKRTSDALEREDFNTYRTLKDIKKSFNDSLQESASANPQLKSLLSEADTAYKKTIPFEEELTSSGAINPTGFYRQLIGEKSGKPLNLDNFLSSYLKTGKNKDYADTLQNLTNLLPDEASKNLIAANYLKDAVGNDGKVNVGLLMRNYQKLGDKQKEILFPGVKNKLDKLETISKAYPELFSIDYNPKTGHQVGKSMGLGGMGVGAATNLLYGNVPAAIASVALPPALGYLGRKAVTSPAFRDALLRKEITRNPEARNALNALYLGSIAQTGGQ
jgi:hypothetical protein